MKNTKLYFILLYAISCITLHSSHPSPDNFDPMDTKAQEVLKKINDLMQNLTPHQTSQPSSNPNLDRPFFHQQTKTATKLPRQKKQSISWEFDPSSNTHSQKQSSSKKSLDLQSEPNHWTRLPTCTELSIDSTEHQEQEAQTITLAPPPALPTFQPLNTLVDVSTNKDANEKAQHKKDSSSTLPSLTAESPLQNPKQQPTPLPLFSHPKWQKFDRVKPQE